MVVVVVVLLSGVTVVVVDDDGVVVVVLSGAGVVEVVVGTVVEVVFWSGAGVVEVVVTFLSVIDRVVLVFSNSCVVVVGSGVIVSVDVVTLIESFLGVKESDGVRSLTFAVDLLSPVALLGALSKLN